jgi:hypothetical protein
LVDSLADLTGADVAASDDLTGSAELGGDWELEYQTGEVEVNAIINPNLNLSWVGALDASLVGHWKLDEGSGGTATDSSGNNNTGTFENSPAYTTGKVGSHAVDFSQDGSSGANEYFVVPKNDNSLDFGSGDFSVSFWFKSDPSDSDSHWLIGDANNGNVGFRIFSQGDNLSFWVTDAEQDSAATGISGALDGNWHHIVALREGNTLKVYKDNILSGNDTNNNLGNINSTDTLRIGASSDSLENYDGQMDDVRLYKGGALSTSDINELFANNAAPVATNDSATTNQNIPVVIDLTANDTDPESNPLTVLQTDYPGHGTTNNNFFPVK